MKDNHNVKIHSSPQVGEYGEFGSEQGIYYQGQVIEMTIKKPVRKTRSHSSLFAFLLFVIMFAWLYIATDMGKRTVDMPRDRVIHIYQD